jgi:hypothetical protein
MPIALLASPGTPNVRREWTRAKHDTAIPMGVKRGKLTVMVYPIERRRHDGQVSSRAIGHTRWQRLLKMPPHTHKAPECPNKHKSKHKQQPKVEAGIATSCKVKSGQQIFLSKRTGQQNATRCSLCKTSLRRVRRLGRPQHHGVARPTGVATCPTAWATPQLPLEPPRCSL